MLRLDWFYSRKYGTPECLTGMENTDQAEHQPETKLNIMAVCGFTFNGSSHYMTGRIQGLIQRGK